MVEEVNIVRYEEKGSGIKYEPPIQLTPSNLDEY